jgi:hypothetical protein
MGRFLIFGKLRQSEDDGFYVETAEGGTWLIHLPWLATEEIDRMLHMHVVVEGGRVGASTVAVSRISEAEVPEAPESETVGCWSAFQDERRQRKKSKASPASKFHPAKLEEWKR